MNPWAIYKPQRNNFFMIPICKIKALPCGGNPRYIQCSNKYFEFQNLKEVHMTVFNQTLIPISKISEKRHHLNSQISLYNEFWARN